MSPTEIANLSGIKIYAPIKSRISFFNSPYLVHFSHQAVDIYPPFDFAPSPVAGKIKFTREFSAPKSSHFESSPKEYLTAIETPSSVEYLVRILHVKPWVRAGDEVEIGEPLGELIRSGYFDFWTDFHLHVEIRPRRDLIRARGGLQLSTRFKGKLCGLSPASNFKGRIMTTRPEYTLVDGPKASIGSITGAPVFVGDTVGILDGGVPHYGQGGVVALGKIEIGAPVSFEKVKIGHVVEIFADGFARFKALPFLVRLGRLPMRGVSGYLSLGNAHLWKIVPNAVGKVNLPNEEEIVFSRHEL